MTELFHRVCWPATLIEKQTSVIAVMINANCGLKKLFQLNVLFVAHATLQFGHFFVQHR